LNTKIKLRDVGFPRGWRLDRFLLRCDTV